LIKQLWGELPWSLKVDVFKNGETLWGRQLSHKVKGVLDVFSLLINHHLPEFSTDHESPGVHHDVFDFEIMPVFISQMVLKLSPAFQQEYVSTVVTY
jgi:hypothetical protein